jgi:hypothetical protein
MEKNMSKFVKGQKVVVTNGQQTHTNNKAWIINKPFYDIWNAQMLPNNGDIGLVLGVVNDTADWTKSVYFVNINGTVYMIGEGGLSEFREEYRPDSITFRDIREKYTELFSDELFSIDLFGRYTEVNYGSEHFQCPSEQDLFQILDALTTLTKFKV